MRLISLLKGNNFLNSLIFFFFPTGNSSIFIFFKNSLSAIILISKTKSKKLTLDSQFLSRDNNHKLVSPMNPFFFWGDGERVGDRPNDLDGLTNTAMRGRQTSCN